VPDGDDDKRERLLDQLDLLGDLHDIGAGGLDGTGAGFEVAADALTGGDGALDALESATDLSDAFDDLL
jgi:hypothetical protein